MELPRLLVEVYALVLGGALITMGRLIAGPIGGSAAEEILFSAIKAVSVPVPYDVTRTRLHDEPMKKDLRSLPVHSLGPGANLNPAFTLVDVKAPLVLPDQRQIGSID